MGCIPLELPVRSPGMNDEEYQELLEKYRTMIHEIRDRNSNFAGPFLLLGWPVLLAGILAGIMAFIALILQIG